MTITTHVGDVHTIFGIDTIESAIAAIAAIAGNHAEDYDLAAAAAGYRQYLETYLPSGHFIDGNEIYADTTATQFASHSVPGIREALADDLATGDGFDISRYANPHCGKCDTPSPTLELHMQHDCTPHQVEDETPRDARPFEVGDVVLCSGRHEGAPAIGTIGAIHDVGPSPERGHEPFAAVYVDLDVPGVFADGTPYEISQVFLSADRTTPREGHFMLLVKPAAQVKAEEALSALWDVVGNIHGVRQGTPLHKVKAILTNYRGGTEH